ncbi:clusterin-like protein 1 [Polymixia lowei]
MRMLLVQTLYISLLCEVLLSAADSPPLSEGTLKELSSDGERYVDEEIKRALFGVKQMKDMMEKEEEKHAHLMDGLRYSSNRKKGAVRLAKETEQKLEEAEQQCHDAIDMSFEECRPCLEDSCKTFSTYACRRGFASFSLKVEEFFKKMSSQLETPDQVYNEENPHETNLVEWQKQKAEGPVDPELFQAEASFSQLQRNVSRLYNQSVDFVKRMQPVFGHVFLVAFTTKIKPKPLSPTQESLSAGFFRATGLDHVFHSVYEFGRTVLEEFSSTVTDAFEEAEEDFQPSKDPGGSLPNSGQSQSGHLCRQLYRQAPECWQLQIQCETCDDYLLKECPSVMQLHSELEEIHLLFNASRQQFEERLQLVKRHTADTLTWLRHMDDKYSWVSQLSNSTLDHHNIFNVTMHPVVVLISYPNLPDVL